MSGQVPTIRISDESEEGQSCQYRAYGTGYAPTTSQPATQSGRSSNNSRSSSGQPPSTKTSTPVGACDHAQHTPSAQENQTLQPFEDTLNRLWSSNHRGESVDPPPFLALVPVHVPRIEGSSRLNGCGYKSANRVSLKSDE
ncbi:hypothetical protein V866_004366 [Kwoniella sp. B9012]